MTEKQKRLWKKLELLGLTKLLNDLQGQAYEQAMAKKLRELTFLYLTGDLNDHHGRKIPDGPAVKALREGLNNGLIKGGMDRFIEEQSPNGAWATDIELTLLSELLDVNLVVETAETKSKQKPMVLNAHPDPKKLTVTLWNAQNTHWQPTIDGQVRSSLGDGNCGYNAFATCSAHIVHPTQARTATDTDHQRIEIIKKQEAPLLRGTLEEAQKAQAAYEQAEKKFTPAQHKQIHDDYLFALQVALDDLPGVQGKMSRTIAPPARNYEKRAQGLHQSASTDFFRNAKRELLPSSSARLRY